jgi:hypothetical protein
MSRTTMMPGFGRSRQCDVSGLSMKPSRARVAFVSGRSFKRHEPLYGVNPTLQWFYSVVPGRTFGSVIPFVAGGSPLR